MNGVPRRFDLVRVVLTQNYGRSEVHRPSWTTSERTPVDRTPSNDQLYWGFRGSQWSLLRTRWSGRLIPKWKLRVVSEVILNSGATGYPPQLPATPENTGVLRH